MSKSRGRRRALVALSCPQQSCGQALGYTDGRRIFVGAPEPTALVTRRVTLCCARPGCQGCLTWHPSGPPEPPLP